VATTRQRAHLQALGYWLISLEPQIDWSDDRPMPYISLHEQEFANKVSQGEHVTMDCSAEVTYCFKWAGCKDPCGLNYDGYGGSDAMLHTLSHYTRVVNAHTGALIVYQNPSHVSMVLEPGSDPLLMSMGSDAGPRAVRLSEERTWHSGPIVLLDIGPL
jgi:hypothetical protein